MATKVKVQPISLKDPAWSVATAKPGDSVELSVTAAKPLDAGQSVEFQIRDVSGGLVEVLKKPTASGNVYKAKWVVPNFPGTATLMFDAVLRETPTPKNGHITSRGRVKSPALTVHGFKVSITSADAAFVPGKETLHVAYKVANEGGVALKGRYEIWGERYPSGAPLFSDSFAPAAGDANWTTFDGKGNAGALSGKLISPEFSPYRVRVIVGIDDASVKDPLGAGRGKVCVAERPFEVVIESLQLRIQNGLNAAVTGDLKKFLAVEPRTPKGAFKAEGRLPTSTETGRMRVACATHTVIGDALKAAGDLVGSGYVGKGRDALGNLRPAPDPTKWARDSGMYTRAELPLEVEPRLRSRDPTKNAAPHHGVFAADALGLLSIEPYLEDHYKDSLYAGAAPHSTYLKNAAHKVKRGVHDAPVHSGTQPIIGYWQARSVIAADGDPKIDRTIDLGPLDADFKYKTGSSELTVYLNRRKLAVGAAGSKKECEEVDATHIKLKAGLTKKGDVVWIVRKDTTAGAADRIDNWTAHPPGDNCHDHYGGLRGQKPNVHFLNDFSAPPGGNHQPIIGRGGAAWPYKDAINLDPDSAGADADRVETHVLDTGASQGLAGFIFSPSYIAGDTYALVVQPAPFPYERTLGYFDPKPRTRVKTGVLSVWRVMTIQNSFRLPNKNTNGLTTDSAGNLVGSPPEKAVNDRKYRGDGVNMSMTDMNKELEPTFNEWVVPEIVLPATDVHQDVNLATYIAAHNGAAIGGANAAGKVMIAGAAKVTNQVAQFDHYRVQLPPNTPPGAQNKISTLIGGKPSGTLSLDIMTAITPAMLGAADPPAGIPIFPFGVGDYDNFVDGVADKVFNASLAGVLGTLAAPVKTMNVLRWPDYYQTRYWDDGTVVGASYTAANNCNSSFTVGLCRGSGQSFFATVSGDAGTFAHEMGHSVHLAHFVGGNFEWKHHDFNFPQCKMSYDFTHGWVPKPAGTVGTIGVGATEDTGWPDTVPAAIPQGSHKPTNPPAAPGSPTIEQTVLAKGTHGVLPMGTFCAKCALKIRGWKDELLPCAWRHPDLF
jgi:hypothetical protein